MKRGFVLVVVALSSLWAGLAGALGLGDAAPRVSPGVWVQGAPADLTDGKNIYVLDFWATWCRPCRETIPHMSGLQAKYKGKNVVVVGVSDEDKATVAPFVSKMGSKMDFRVAVDPGRALVNKYGDIPEFRGIPFAVVIDTRGDIAWYGHPLNGLESALDALVAGTYSIGDQLKRNQAKKLLPKYFSALATGDEAGAKLIGAQLLLDAASDPTLLNELSWSILTDVPSGVRDLELAKNAAKLAFTASGEAASEIADTYALALFETGDVSGAISYQKKAIALCKNAGLLPELKAALARYEASLAHTD